MQGVELNPLQSRQGHLKNNWKCITAMHAITTGGTRLVLLVNMVEAVALVARMT